MELEKHIINSGIKGPTIVITGRFHGNEPIGEIVVHKLVKEIEAGKLNLLKGRLVLFPLLNPFAKDQNKRYVATDMNRYICPNYNKGELPEERLRSYFVKALENISSNTKEWHLIDIHSVDMNSDGHVICADSNESLELAPCTFYDSVYLNWRNAQLSVKTEDLKVMGRRFEEHEKFTLAAIYGAKEMCATSAICIEAGQHDDKNAEDKAYKSVLSILSYHHMIDEKHLHTHLHQKRIVFKAAIIKRDDSEHLLEIQEDAQRLSAGQTILKGNNRAFKVPETSDSWIIAHPKVDPAIGDHFGYLAVIE